MLMRFRPATGLLVVAAVMASQPARSAPADICALLTPYLQSAPDHFLEMRGVKSSGESWDAKPMPLAEALNAKCTINLYIKDRPDLDCEVKFDNDKLVEQDAFYREAVVGFDFCLANLKFGDSVRRVSEQSDSATLRTESVTWYKAVNKNYKQTAQFGGGVTKGDYKSSGSLNVKIELFFRPGQVLRLTAMCMPWPIGSAEVMGFGEAGATVRSHRRPSSLTREVRRRWRRHPEPRHVRGSAAR